MTILQAYTEIIDIRPDLWEYFENLTTRAGFTNVGRALFYIYVGPWPLLSFSVTFRCLPMPFYECPCKQETRTFTTTISGFGFAVLL